MNNDAVREYLKLIMDAVSENVKGAQIQETQEGPVLICSVQSPFNENEEMGYQISIIPDENGLLVFEVMLYLFVDTDAQKAQGINAVINRINPYIVLGGLRYFEDSRTVMFVQGFVLDDEVETATVTEILGKTISIMENTAFNAGEYINRYLRGEKLEVILGEIDEEE